MGTAAGWGYTGSSGNLGSRSGSSRLGLGYCLARWMGSIHVEDSGNQILGMTGTEGDLLGNLLSCLVAGHMEAVQVDWRG